MVKSAFNNTAQPELKRSSLMAPSKNPYHFETTRQRSNSGTLAPNSKKTQFKYPDLDDKDESVFAVLARTGKLVW
jgi:hypothetical protein